MDDTMTKVELQPYALRAIAHHLPHVYRRLTDDFQPVVPLVNTTKDNLYVAIPQLGLQLRFRCPAGYQHLFALPPGEHLGEKAGHFLAQAYEKWYAEHQLVHSVFLVE